MMKYTEKEYVNLDFACQYFNEALFDNVLPGLLITYQRKANSRGFYHPSRFRHRENGEEAISELALNPDLFEDRSDMEILSTLVHELVHHWQQNFGKPSKGAYHNKEFAAKMDEIGLQPTDDGTEEGKPTGRKITHLIIPGGKFDELAKKFLEEYKFKLNWESLTAQKSEKKKTDPSKVKFICECPNSIWGKIFSLVICPDCQRVFKWEQADVIIDYLRANEREEDLAEYLAKVEEVEKRG